MTTWAHEHFMDLALEEAATAEAADEVPVGAIVVSRNGDVIGRGHNHPISADDPTAHAEILAIRDAAQTIANYRLTGCTLYCTIEPCAMCAGAIIHSRLSCVVFGASDPKAGAAGSLYNSSSSSAANHKTCSSVFLT
jgi:haloalkane dehalogenase/tRNA(adenine34) deaminase